MAEKKENKAVETASVSTSKEEVSPTYMKVRNTANRPLELVFSDGDAAVRIGAKSVEYIDEARLEKSSFAKNQVDDYIRKGNLRILARNLKKKEV